MAKRKVPTRIKETPRRAATSVYVFPRKKDFPIGDLYHARLALIYALSPVHANVRSEVLSAVEDEYPQYNWSAWWNKRRKGKKNIRSWSSYTRELVSNPRLLGGVSPLVALGIGYFLARSK